MIQRINRYNTDSFKSHGFAIYTFLLTVIIISVSHSYSQRTIDSDSLKYLITSDTTFNPQERLNLSLRLIDLFNAKNPKRANELIISAIETANQLKDTSQIILLNIQIANNKNKQCTYGEAYKYYNQANEFIAINGSKSDKANIEYLIANNYYDWSKYKLAKEFYEKSKDKYTKTRNKSGIAKSLVGLSAIASNYSDYELAIGLMKRAREIYIDIGDTKSLSLTSIGLGVIMENWGKNNRALSYYNAALKNFRKHNNTLQEMNMLLHIGDIYMNLEDYSQALKFFNEALILETKVDNLKLRSICYSNMGDTFLEMKDYQRALLYQEKSLLMKYEVGDNNRISKSLLSIGKIYYALKNYSLAEQNLKQCLSISREVKLKEVELESLLYLAEMNNKRKDFESSFKYLKQYIELKDLIFDQESQEMLNDLSVKYEAKRIEKENHILKQKDSITTLELENQKDSTLFALIFIIFLIIISLVIIFFINLKSQQSRRNFTILAKKNKEITVQKDELSKLNKELSFSREQYMSIVENATIGMYQTQKDGSILFANTGLVKMLGYNNLDELKKLNLNKENLKRDSFIELLEEQHIISGREDTWLRSDGSKMYVNESAWVVRDLNKNIVHYEGIVEDISKRKEIEIELTESQIELKNINSILVEKNKEFEIAKNAAVAANEIKSQFIANVSHEIRTPMNSVIGFTELLSNIIVDKKQLTYIGAIISSSKSLLNLINEILDLSKIQANEIELNYEPVSFEDIIHDMEQVFNLRFTEKELIFQVIVKPDVPATVFLDKIRIRQILYNLIGNAIKFTKKGKITLEIISINKGNNTDLCISISDTGMGIPKSEQHTIFEAFKQSKASGENTYGGTGLGLSITKKLVEAMGGKISIDSIENKGSAFNISLPNIEIASNKTQTSQRNVQFLHEPTINTNDEVSNANPELINKIGNDIIKDLESKFGSQWIIVNQNNIINDIVDFCYDLIAFAKESNDTILIEFCQSLLFYAQSFDIENINKYMEALGSIFTKKVQ